ncbi:uncharacterized protein MJAP1_004095 [Malassezia japonica]|uniref:chitin deacetylase n=1 Tax=Malassezia japonica TaxID=223818 RepID=A0AAF0JHT4_9BASI|nr:uncharacterized protein MJAP1_004095 [Malassezia japonica]WFD41101.1 hypothetical protein MJAP1_004095 [Malassezia japonica]
MLVQKLTICLFIAGASATIGRVHLGHHHVAHQRRDTPTNAASFAKLTNAHQECQSYGDDTVTKMINQNEFPKPDHIAGILDGDKDAHALYNEIKDKIPKADVRKGTKDHRGFAEDKPSYPESDPDCWWSMSGCNKPKHDNIIQDVTQCKEDSTWGLTFDDGPFCAHNKLYNFLQEQKLRATMFYIGSNVLQYPYQAQRAIVDGHDVCHHSWSHRLMTTLSNEQVFAELYYSGKVIKKVMGVTPRCWRPPQGDVDDRVRYIASALGYRTIMWKEDTDDWNIQPAGELTEDKVDSNYRKIFNKADKESPVVLTHEISSHTINEFIKMYPEMKKAYKHVAPVSVCTGVQNPYPEDITYPTFDEYTSGNMNYQGLPSGNKIKADDSASFKPVPIDQEKGGFGHPGQKAASSKSSSSAASSSSSSSHSARSTSSDSTNDTASDATDESTNFSGQGSNSAASLVVPVIGPLAAVVGALIM